MKNPPWNRHISCIIKSALLGGLLIATTALATLPKLKSYSIVLGEPQHHHGWPNYHALVGS